MLFPFILSELDEREVKLLYSNYWPKVLFPNPSTFQGMTFEKSDITRVSTNSIAKPK